MTSSRILLLSIIGAAVALFFIFDLQQLLSLESLKSQQTAIESYRTDHPFLAPLLYAAIYIIITALSLPGAVILTLAGGAIFGLLWGTVIISFASTIGATFAFLAARFLLRDAVTARFRNRLQSINDGIEREGSFYLFTLRLVPLFPFFMINLVMGLTSIKTRTFYWVSQVGMLAGTIVYVNAGTQLAKIDSLSAIFSPDLLASFALLGLFPLLAKKIVEFIQKQKAYSAWQRPKKFDNNIVVIGGGSGGLVTAYIAAAVKAKVTLIEKDKMGGDCLNTGCVPSKALIRSAKWLSQLKHSKEFGIQTAQADFEFADIMERVQSTIKTIEPHDSIERYSSLGVDVITGNAKIISPWVVQVRNGDRVKVLTTRSIVIATGARPYLPSIPGIEKVDPLTSDTIWNIRELPKRLLILGGGPIACELAQSFARLGSQVIQVVRGDRILAKEDREVSDLLMARFQQEGIDIRLKQSIKAFNIEEGEKVMVAEQHGDSSRIPFDQVLVAFGRAANISGYGAEELNITLSAGKTIKTNPFQETNYPNIYACGDVTGPYQFTHFAAHQAWYASVNALFGQFKKFRTDYSVIPRSTFTDPEIARVGLNEQEAKEQKIPYELTTYNLSELDRAIVDSAADGFIKVLTQPGKDKILGVTIAGEHSGDLIAEFVLAMKHDLGLNKILGTIHIYPTMAEANKFVAGNWKRAHAPQKLLAWIERFHRWRRG